MYTNLHNSENSFEKSRFDQDKLNNKQTFSNQIKYEWLPEGMCRVQKNK